MGGGKAEVRQDAVADEMGHGPAERFDGCGTGGLERPQDLPSVLRVESPRQLGRADDVAEHDGEVSSGSHILGRWGCRTSDDAGCICGCISWPPTCAHAR